MLSRGGPRRRLTTHAALAGPHSGPRAPPRALAGALRAVVLAAALAGALACREPGPSPEWVAAQAAYDAAMAERGVGALGPSWDEAIRLLRAVPPAHRSDHRRAAALLADIEGTRARTLAELRRGSEDAEALLRLPKGGPALDPPRTTRPADIAPPAALCAARCRDALPSCLAASGCTKEGSAMTCEGEAAVAAAKCRLQQIACERACDPTAKPTCDRCDLEANACFMALGACAGSGTDFTCRPGVEDGERTCRKELSRCRAACR
jgi:hypothetical protein